MQGDFQAPQITEVRNPGSAQPYCGVAGAVCRFSLLRLKLAGY